MLTIFLVWVAPLLWGALIGYLTNALAIRMLFRPLTRKYLFGIPVPLTPGIIPRRRGELAVNIGRMVARDLLSPEAIRERLRTEAFRRALEGQFRSLRESVLRRPLAELATQAGNAFTGASAGAAADDIAWLDLLRHLLERVLQRLVGSRGFIYGVRTLMSRVIEDLGERRLTELVGAEQLQTMITGTLLPALRRDELRARVARVIKEWLRQQRQTNAPLDRYLTPETVELLLALFRRSLPALLDVVFAWLRGPGVRRELEVHGRSILRDILDKLNLMQKVFITAGQYDRTLSQRMPEIVTDVIDQAEAATATTAVRDHICSGARRALAQWRARGLGDLAGGTEPQLDDLVDHLVQRVFGAITEPAPGGDGIAPAEQVIESWYHREGDASVAELAARYLGIQPAAIADALSNLLLQYLSRPATASQLAELIPGLVGDALEAASAGAAGATLGDVLAIPPATEPQLDRFLTRQVVEFLGERLPAVMETIDVESLVAAKVDALDARAVERLLLDVMARHLKWIKLFGAILGAAIGLLLIALRAVGPVR